MAKEYKKIEELAHDIAFGNLSKGNFQKKSVKLLDLLYRLNSNRIFRKYHPSAKFNEAISDITDDYFDSWKVAYALEHDSEVLNKVYQIVFEKYKNANGEERFIKLFEQHLSVKIRGIKKTIYEEHNFEESRSNKDAVQQLMKQIKKRIRQENKKAGNTELRIEKYTGDMTKRDSVYTYLKKIGATERELDKVSAIFGHKTIQPMEQLVGNDETTSLVLTDNDAFQQYESNENVQRTLIDLFEKCKMIASETESKLFPYIKYRITIDFFLEAQSNLTMLKDYSEYLDKNFLVFYIKYYDDLVQNNEKVRKYWEKKDGEEFKKVIRKYNREAIIEYLAREKNISRADRTLKSDLKKVEKFLCKVSGERS